MEHSVLHDTPNGYNEFIQMARTIIESAPVTTRFAIMYADINGFQSVNEFYGYQEGNRLLSAFHQLLDGLSHSHLCTCILSDHFLCLSVLPDEMQLETYTKQEENTLTQFIAEQSSHHSNCRLSVACGLCIVQQQDILKAIDDANIARKEAKLQNFTKIVWFNDKMQERVYQRKQMEQEIYAALHAETFTFYLQPKVNIETGKIIGAEALVRWIKPDGTMVYPDSFIPIMEENGTIRELDLLVLRQVCAAMQQRIVQHLPVLCVSVNLSRVHIDRPNEAQYLHEIVSQYHIPPYLMEFELTETILMNQMDGAKKLVDDLRGYGYKVSIDDFGSGYAGINIWQELNADVIKLDKNFLSTDPVLQARNQILLPEIIHVSHQLQTFVICEGVETLEQCSYIKSVGCISVQGYYFSRPLPQDEFAALLLKNDFADRLPAPATVPDTDENTERRARAMAQAIFHISPTGMLGIEEPSGKLLFVTDSMLEICGYTRQELLQAGDNWHTLLFHQPPLSLDNYDDQGQLHMEGDIFCKDGTMKSVRIDSGHTTSVEWGSYVLCCFYDITAWKQAQTQSLEASRDLENVIHIFHGGQARIALDTDLHVLNASDSWYELSGYTAAEFQVEPLCGRLCALAPDDSVEELRTLFQGAYDGKVLQMRYRVRRKDGSLAWYSGFPLKIEQDTNHTAILEGIFFDITDQYEKELASRLEQERIKGLYAHLYEVDPCAVIQTSLPNDKGITILQANSAAWDIFGKPDGQTILFLDHIHPHDRERIRTQICALQSDGDCFDYHCQILDYAGQYRHIRGKAKRTTDMEGQPILLTCMLDVTPEIQLQEKVRLMNLGVSEFAGMMGLGVWEYDIANCQLVHFREAGKKGVINLSTDGLTPFLERHVHPDDIAVLHALMQRVNLNHGGHETSNLRVRLFGGEYLWIHVAVSALRDQQDTIYSFIALTNDMTEQKELEARIASLQIEHKKPYGSLHTAEHKRANRQFLFGAIAMVLALTLMIWCYTAIILHDFIAISTDSIASRTQAQADTIASCIANEIQALDVLRLTYLKSNETWPESSMPESSIEALGQVYTHHPATYYQDDILTGSPEDLRLAAGETIITDVYRTSDQEQAYLFDIIMPILRDNVFLGAMEVSLPASQLVDASCFEEFDNIHATLLIHGDGTILPVRNTSLEGSQNLFTIMRENDCSEQDILSLQTYMKSQDVAAFQLEHPYAQVLYVAVADLGYQDWHYITFIESSFVDQHAQNILYKNLLALGLSALLSMLVVVLALVLLQHGRKQLHIAVERYGAVLHLSDSDIFEYHYDTDILTLSQRVGQHYQIHGRVLTDFLTKKSEWLVHPEDRATVIRLIQQVQPGQQEAVAQIRCLDLSGNYVPCILQVLYLWDKNHLVFMNGKIMRKE